MKQLVKNAVWALRGGNNGKLFESLARSGKKPEQVDGYVACYDSPAVQDLLDRVVETIADLVPEKGSVLDLGCGTGRYLRALRPRVGADLYGIDLSQATIENYTRKLEGVSAAAGDFAQGNPFGVRFDLIYSITVIQYVPFFKLGRFFGAVREALKERGRFYLQFPHGGREASLHANYAYTRYRPDYLMRRVSDAGFEVLASGFMDPEHRGDFGYYLLAERAW